MHFLDSTLLGRRYRFKLSARLAACRALPRLTTRSPDPSGALAPSDRGTPRGVRLRSHPVEHGFRSFPAANRWGLAPHYQLVRIIGAFAPQVRFVFAPVCRVCPGRHGIRQRDCSAKRDYSAASPSHPASSITSTGRHTTHRLAGGSGHSPGKTKQQGRWRAPAAKQASQTGVGAPSHDRFAHVLRLSLPRIGTRSEIVLPSSLFDCRIF